VRYLLALIGILSAIDPQFEVASVKAVKREVPLQKPLTCAFPARGRFSGFGDLRWFVACAYRIPTARARQEITGLPQWADDEVFEIDAKSSIEDAAGFTLPMGLEMLRTLLTHRFKLTAHRENKEVPTYSLVLARRDRRLGPQLRPTPPDCATWIGGGRRGEPPPADGDLPCGRQAVSAFRVRTTAMPLALLANLLSPRVNRPVQDQTGLGGTFALDLQWRPEQSPPGTEFSENLPTSVFTALQEQLGLKLESTKSAVDLLVVDHVEHPAAN
jgi:uncharacterized protein (TIGR03435 family)